MTSYHNYLNEKNFLTLLSLFDKWTEGEFAGLNIVGFYHLIIERDDLTITVVIGLVEPSISIHINGGEHNLFYLSWFDWCYIEIIDIKNKVIEFGKQNPGAPIRCTLSLKGTPIVKVDTQFRSERFSEFVTIRK